MPDNQFLLNEFVTNLRKRKVEDSEATARLTAELLRSVISQHKGPHSNKAASLFETVKKVGEKIIAANPVVFTVGNIVRRVLHIIREEEFSLVSNSDRELTLSTSSNNQDTNLKQEDDFPVMSDATRCFSRQPSLHALLDHLTESVGDKNARSGKLKNEVIAAINELIEDIDASHELIAEQALELIHHNEVILTFGHSRTVMKFLFAAKEKRRSFGVFVAEGAPKYRGQSLAKELVARGLQTTVITDAAIFAMISRVNKVIVGVHAVMGNGGVVGPVGLNMVALAARKYAVPFVVVAGTHKLCPLYPENPGVGLNEMRSPSEVLQLREFLDCSTPIGNGVTPLLDVANPAFDYVPPELVSLFVTERGGHKPSFMYRLVADYYSKDDLVLQKKATS